MEFDSLPDCRKCEKGTMLPLSDYGRDGAPIMYKAWVCTNPDCTFNLKIRNGDVFVNEPITDASLPQQHHMGHDRGGFRSVR